jgi:hypothetical protein
VTATSGVLDSAAADAALKAQIAAAGPLEADYLRRTFGVSLPRPTTSWVVPILATAGLAWAAFAVFFRR